MQKTKIAADMTQPQKNGVNLWENTNR